MVVVATYIYAAIQTHCLQFRVSWDVALCQVVISYWHFEGYCCLHLHDSPRRLPSLHCRWR